MIPIKSTLPTYDITSKGSIHEKQDLKSLQSPMNRRERELQLTDNLLRSGQSLYELCTILEVDPKTRPILFFEKLNQLQKKNAQIEQYNKERNNQT